MSIASAAPGPRIPKSRKITSVEELLPAAREMVSRKPANMYEGLEIQKGHRVLFVNDTTADQLVVESFSTAIRERGGHVDIITLEGFRGLKDPVDMLDNMFSNNWYPGWAWEAATEADIVLLTAFIKKAHTPIPRLPKNPIVDNMEMTADLMVSEHQKYPVELRDAIDEVTWEKLGNSTRVKWTDLEGTDIDMSPTAADWERAIGRLKQNGLPYHHGHLMLPAPCPSMNGVYMTSSITFGGPIPRTRMIVEKGRVVKVEGGGKFAERLRESFERYGHLTGRSCPGPGINWISTVGICTNPHAQRSPFFDELAGSARVYAWSFGHRRSGVFHTSIGEGMASPNHKIIRHMDTYFNTLVTDKGTVMENGHLAALDDRKIRHLASKYGDPDKLLKEIWIPAVPGVNVP